MAFDPYARTIRETTWANDASETITLKPSAPDALGRPMVAVSFGDEYVGDYPPPYAVRLLIPDGFREVAAAADETPDAA